ncbi:hypothetical protein ILYODFUR_030227 [Ilyodon furcidens]|uniref:Uncharacterized protein n=1 Tax=Ilyodon furcidens TaxID=33524 RepID=A0ABV0TQN1_9TELE
MFALNKITDEKKMSFIYLKSPKLKMYRRWDFLHVCSLSSSLLCYVGLFFPCFFLSKLIRSDRGVSTSEQLRQVTVKVTLRIPQWQRGLTSVTWYPTEVMIVGFRMQMCRFVSTHQGG